MRNRSTVQLCVAEVILDFTIYPRHQIDEQNVREIAKVMEAGVLLPPIVIDRDSRRVIDGFHRVTAKKRREGDKALIACEEREYPSEAAMFEEAMLLNSGHGRKLTSYDRTRCVLLARELGLTDGKIAASLQMTVEQLAAWPLTRTAISEDDRLVPVKARSAPALVGARVSAEQLAANTRSDGLPILRHVNQVINSLDGGLVDLSDVLLLERLTQLRDRIDQLLAVPV